MIRWLLGVWRRARGRPSAPRAYCGPRLPRILPRPDFGEMLLEGCPGRKALVLRWMLAVRTAETLGIDPEDPLPCHWCGRRLPWWAPHTPGRNDDLFLTIDHVQPRAERGPSSMANLVLACVTCNLRRADHWRGCQTCARGDFCIMGHLLGMRWSARCIRACLFPPSRVPITRAAVSRKKEPKILVWLVRRAHGENPGHRPWQAGSEEVRHLLQETANRRMSAMLDSPMLRNRLFTEPTRPARREPIMGFNPPRLSAR